MAYAILAGVDPVVGIYTAFFPVLVYVLMGTMPHVSMGTFAVISILASKEGFYLITTVNDLKVQYNYRPQILKIINQEKENSKQKYTFLL